MNANATPSAGSSPSAHPLLLLGASGAADGTGAGADVAGVADASTGAGVAADAGGAAAEAESAGAAGNTQRKCALNFNRR
jgi:hypothetical protein